jgi:peroxiredoxin (alkyl hydroperoxide reductase subunit C)
MLFTNNKKGVCMIRVGDTIPNVSSMHKVKHNNEWADTRSLFAGKRILLLGLPGAFLVEYAASQLRSYEFLYDKFMNEVDEIWYTSTDDCFIQNAWNKFQGIKHIQNLPDPDATWSDAIGMTEDMTKEGLSSKRSHRYAMVLDNLVVKTIKYEDFSHNPMTCFQVTDADSMMQYFEIIKTNYERWDDNVGREKNSSVLS